MTVSPGGHLLPVQDLGRGGDPGVTEWSGRPPPLLQRNLTRLAETRLAKKIGLVQA